MIDAARELRLALFVTEANQFTVSGRLFPFVGEGH